MDRERALPGIVLLLCAGAAMAAAWGGAVVRSLAACCVVGLACSISARMRRRGRARSLCDAAFVVLLAVLAGATRLAAARAPRACDLAFSGPAREGALELTGLVAAFPETTEGGWRVPLTVESVSGDTRPAGVRVVLSGSPDGPDGLSLTPGTRVRASGRFYPPEPPANPGEPDTRLLMAIRDASGTLYLGREARLERIGGSRVGLATRMAIGLRDSVGRVAEASLGPGDARLLHGLMFGSLSSDMESEFESAGIAYLFSVSGLHVGSVAGVVVALLGALRVPRQIAGMAAAGVVWVYALACGLRPSVVRAAFMFSCLCLSTLARRRVGTMGLLSLAALAMFAANPWLVLDAGAQLSYGVVFTVLWLAPRIGRRLALLPASIARVLASSCAAQVGAAPLVAWYFGRLAPVGIVSAAPCAALCGAAVAIGFAAGLAGVVCPAIALPLGAANALVLSALRAVVAVLARMPFGCFGTARPPLWLVVGWYSCIIAAGLARRATRAALASGRLALFALALLATATWVAALRRPCLETVFLSVGQGDAIFMRSPSGRTVLVDGGGRPGAGRDPGAGTVVPYLSRRGVRALDVVVASHPHEDHIAGLRAVLESLPVRALVKPVLPPSAGNDADRERDRDLRLLAEARGAAVVEARRGGVIDLGDGVRIEVLGPSPGILRAAAPDLNDLSLVLKVTYGDFCALLTGDAGGEALADALGLDGHGAGPEAGAGPETKAFACAVLKAPHHGAAGSLSGAAASRVRARWAVVSVGPNAFGHPSPQTIRSLELAGARVLRTDAHGAVTATSDGRRTRVWSVRMGRVPPGDDPLGAGTRSLELNLLTV